MDHRLLLEYYEEQGLKEYHGSKSLDALKHLSERTDLPKQVREHYEGLYYNALTRMEPCAVRDFGERLYDFLDGREDPIISEVRSSIRVKDRTICSVEIKIPYFERVAEYAKKHGFTVRVQSSYSVYDIRKDDGSSLLMDAIKQKKESSNRPHMTNSSHSKYFPWIMDDVQYMLTTHGGFHRPYNGIGADAIIRVIEDHKGNRYGGYGDGEIEQRVAYVNRSLLQNMSFYVGVDLYSKYRILTAEDERRIDRETSKQMKELWDKA